MGFMEQEIEKLLSLLTLEEKISMIHGATLFKTAGVERLGIPPLCFSDGPMGVRAEFEDRQWRALEHTDDFVTYLPCNSAVASTWNRELAYVTGSVLGAETRGRGKDVILAPGINIKRTPLCGRNFEYFSEDPYLVSEMVVPLVKGVQQNDVAACVKHFAANSQEENRLWVDTEVDEKTLQEIYFPGFRAAIEKGGLLTIMGAYNRLQGEHCCTSQRLLNGTLRQDWGFDGLIVSDWGGVHDTVLAAMSALDVEMDVRDSFDDDHMALPLLEKVRSGEIPETRIDEKVRNILRLMFRLKMIGPEKEQRKSGAYNTPQHRESALQVAQESIILLKNEDHILPLDAGKLKNVAVIGGNAIMQHSFGGGSGEIKALYEITPLMGIAKHLGGNVRVRYADGYGRPVMGARPEINWQATSTQDGQRPKEPELTPANLTEAIELAKHSDAVIFVGGLNHDYDVEGLDRRDMALPYGQDQVLARLLEVRPDTVVVMVAGSPVEMPWLSQAKTLVWSYYAGMEGGSALADVLFGKVNPSGKLAESFLQNAEQCRAKCHPERVVYTEGTMVGYRDYDARKVPVNFCFGHGLSYTTFRYDGMNISGNDLHLTVTNTGDRVGKETVQLYVASPHSHVLRGFEKIELKPGESKVVTFTLAQQDFAEYDVEKKGFFPVLGDYEIQIGASGRDIRLTAAAKVRSDGIELVYRY